MGTAHAGLNPEGSNLATAIELTILAVRSWGEKVDILIYSYEELCLLLWQNEFSRWHVPLSVHENRILWENTVFQK